MDNMNRLTWWRLCLLVASLALNAFLLLVAGWLLVNFIGAEYRSHVYAKTVAANLPVGLSLLLICFTYARLLKSALARRTGMAGRQT